MTDPKDLLKKIRRGEEAAFKDLYTHLKYCTKPVKDFGGSEEDALDKFQEALLIFYKQARKPSFSLTVPVRTYLFAIVKNLWSQELRNRKKRNVLPITDVEHILPDFSSIELDRKKRREKIHKKAIEEIQKMTGRCREILTEFYVGGFDLTDIAASLDLKKGSIKTRKAQCLNKIKAILKKYSNEL